LITTSSTSSLPAGTDVAAVESQLESSDLRDAAPVTKIVAWIYNTLYDATIDRQNVEAAAVTAKETPPVAPVRPTELR
jgi:hypothetical protein